MATGPYEVFAVCPQAKVQLQLATPFLPYLNYLQLVGLGLQIFPLTLAPCLGGLSALDLSHNQLERLPKSLGAITVLKALDVTQYYLQLHESDVHLLASLPGLRQLAILSQRARIGSEGRQSQDSLNHLQALSERCPDVQLL